MIELTELIQRTRQRWNQLGPTQRAELLELAFVSRVAGYRVHFAGGLDEGDVAKPLEKALFRLVNCAEVKYFYVKAEPFVRPSMTAPG
jgi:hypothetical protein